MGFEIKCDDINEVKVENHTGWTETFAKIDDFCDDLKVRLKSLDTQKAMLAVTSYDEETKAVTHQTLEITPKGEGHKEERNLSITTIKATPTNDQGLKLYNRLAENSGIWTGGDETNEDKKVPDGSFVEFGLGNINNTICLIKD